MSVYIEPCNYGTDEGEPPSQGNPSQIDGDLDAQNYRIVNLQQSEGNKSDAATVGYISDWIGRINRGGTMEADLYMGQFKHKQQCDQKDDEDVINEKYFDKIVMQTKPYAFGRYIVFRHADQTSTYHGAGSRKKY